MSDTAVSHKKVRHKSLIDCEDAVLLIIDVQERFAGHIYEFDEMVDSISRMAQGAQILGMPVVITEQYVKGLGPTVSAITEHLPNVPRFEKSCFSACGDEKFGDYLRKLNRNQVLVCGIEAHVCVNQTVHDLLKRGYEVHLIENGISSRSFVNKELALKKMYGAGALPSCLEMALFEMLEDSQAVHFKAVQTLVK